MECNRSNRTPSKPVGRGIRWPSHSALCLSVFLFVCLSICRTLFLSVCPFSLCFLSVSFVRRSIVLSVSYFVCLYVCLSVFLYQCKFVCRGCPCHPASCCVMRVPLAEIRMKDHCTGSTRLHFEHISLLAI